jgi:hypothetical protein
MKHSSFPIAMKWVSLVIFNEDNESLPMYSKSVHGFLYALCYGVINGSLLDLFYVLTVIIITFIEPLFVSLGVRLVVRKIVEELLNRFDPSCVQILMK